MALVLLPVSVQLIFFNAVNGDDVIAEFKYVAMCLFLYTFVEGTPVEGLDHRVIG